MNIYLPEQIYTESDSPIHQHLHLFVLALRSCDLTTISKTCVQISNGKSFFTCIIIASAGPCVKPKSSEKEPVAKNPYRQEVRKSYLGNKGAEKV